MLQLITTATVAILAGITIALLIFVLVFMSYFAFLLLQKYLLASWVRCSFPLIVLVVSFTHLLQGSSITFEDFH